MARIAPLEELAGQIVATGPAASPTLITAGDTELAVFRHRLFKSWNAGESIRDLRAPLTGLADRLEASLASMRVGESSTSLPLSRIKQIDQMAARLVDQAFEEINETVEVAVGKSIKRAQNGQTAHLRRLGIRPPSASARRAIRKDVMGMLDEEFPPGSGETYRTRLHRLQQSRKVQLRSILRQSKREDVRAAIQRDVKNALLHSTPGGRTPVKGGSAFKQARRLMVAEETRISNEVEIRTLRAAGVGFAYWRLNPSHRWYGGHEICEQLASRTGAGVRSSLRREGADPSTVDTNGLYLLNTYPSYPHPYCRCFPEAWAP